VDAEAKALTGEMKRTVETVEERSKKVEEKLKAIASERVAKSAGTLKGKFLPMEDARRGVLPMLGRERPGWYDPKKSFVWGAPPVDNMGRIGDRRR
jgi:ribosomal protein L29